MRQTLYITVNEYNIKISKYQNMLIYLIITFKTSKFYFSTVYSCDRRIFRFKVTLHLIIECRLIHLTIIYIISRKLIQCQIN